jgi:hypothetical protein
MEAMRRMYELVTVCTILVDCVILEVISFQTMIYPNVQYARLCSLVHQGCDPNMKLLDRSRL